MGRRDSAHHPDHDGIDNQHGSASMRSSETYCHGVHRTCGNICLLCAGTLQGLYSLSAAASHAVEFCIWSSLGVDDGSWKTNSTPACNRPLGTASPDCIITPLSISKGKIRSPLGGIGLLLVPQTAFGYRRRNHQSGPFPQGWTSCLGI